MFSKFSDTSQSSEIHPKALDDFNKQQKEKPEEDAEAAADNDVEAPSNKDEERVEPLESEAITEDVPTESRVTDGEQEDDDSDDEETDLEPNSEMISTMEQPDEIAMDKQVEKKYPPKIVVLEAPAEEKVNKTEACAPVNDVHIIKFQ